MDLYCFRMEAKQMELLEHFLEHHYIGLKDCGVGDLEQSMLGTSNEPTNLLTGNQSEEKIDLFQLFAGDMEDGDLVLLVCNEQVFIGDLGDYFYVEQEKEVVQGHLHHRRGVTWLNQLRLQQLNQSLQKWIVEHPSLLSKYTKNLDAIELSTLMGRTGYSYSNEHTEKLELIHQSLNVLKEALHSDNSERRERAAIAILQYYTKTSNS